MDLISIFGGDSYRYDTSNFYDAISRKGKHFYALRRDVLGGKSDADMGLKDVNFRATIEWFRRDVFSGFKLFQNIFR